MGLRTDIVIGNLQEKMKGIGEGSMIMMNSAQAKLKAVGANEMMNNLQEKLTQQSLMLENSGLFLFGWFDKIFPPETRERVLHWLRVVAPYVVGGVVLLVLLCCFIRFIGCCCLCIGRCIVCICSYIGYCCLFIFRCIGYCCLGICRFIGSCCRGIGGCCGIRMMKAPGLAFQIPRFLFEACPRLYFRLLRAFAG